MEKRTEIQLAKKRRARFLKEFLRRKCTKTALAKKHGVSSARMGQLLKDAMKDQREAAQ